MRFLALALALLLGTSCSHATRIETEPEGAVVHVNGVPLGGSPVSWETRSGLPDEAFLKVEKEGFAPARDVKLKKSYRADASLLLLLAGVFPYFFTARFDDRVSIKLDPLPSPRPSGGR